MKWSEVVGLLGLVLALPGFVLVFVDGKFALGVACLVIVALLFIAKWYLERPHFEIRFVDKELKFSDPAGKHAILVRRQEAISNYPGITEFWCRNIGASGAIKNLLIDGAAPFLRRGMAGDEEVCKRFDRPLKRGEVFTTVLQYELEDSFSEAHEGLIHIVEGKTKRLKITIEFQAGRSIRNPRALLRYGGQEHSELGNLEVSANRLHIEIKNPKLGAQYCVEWDW